MGKQREIGEPGRPAKTRNETKAARLIILRNLQRAGYLDGMSLSQIGDRFEVNRSTILRDLRDLPGVEAELERLQSQWWGETSDPAIESHTLQ